MRVMATPAAEKMKKPMVDHLIRKKYIRNVVAILKKSARDGEVVGGGSEGRMVELG